MSHAAAALPRDELVLGRYRPVQPLGTGGSGSVWLARDEAQGGQVALKIVAREGRAACRAEREAAAASRLDHSRCLRAVDFGGDAEHVYIAYEYVPGDTLRNALRGGELDDAGTVEAAAQILDGLAHAHAHGIVHRDVKPSNVLLADDEVVSVRLLDFGLAVFDNADTLTAAGDVPGTLAYISPERLKGKPAEPAADVWAVGVILWEALAGWHPFWTSSMLDTARRIQDGAPSLAEARPDLPDALISVVDRALARDPGRRPSASRMAGALRSAWRSRERRREPRARTAKPQAGRIVAAGLAALFTGWTAAALPFYPEGTAWLLALAAGVVTLARERAGLALALAVPILPLGNQALGLALAWTVLAAAWLVLSWRDARAGFLFVLGPLFAPVAALGLVPLALLPVQNAIRRAASAGAAVFASVAVAAVHGRSLPLTDAAPRSLRLDETESATQAAGHVADVLVDHPPLLLLAAVLAAASAALPSAVRRGRRGIALWGALVAVAAAFAAPGVAALPLAATTCLTCALLAGAVYLRETGVSPTALLERARVRAAAAVVPANRAGAARAPD